jgi:hypothetical protein
MIKPHRDVLLASIILLLMAIARVCADAPGAPTESGAVLVFPDFESEFDWRVQQFWPLGESYGWKIVDLLDGEYRIVVRVASSMPGGRRISAGDARKEVTTSKGKGKFIDRSDGKEGPKSGFVALQLIDLRDLGLDNPKPCRLRVRFSTIYKDRGTVTIVLPTVSISGECSGVRVRSSRRKWVNGEMRLATLNAIEKETRIGIQYDVFLVRNETAAN